MKGASVVLGCVAALAAAASVARADVPSPSDVEAAREHYKRGVQLYDEGRYEPALGELERANALSPTYKLLYNIALVQMRLGDFAGALESFEGYRSAVAQGRATIPAARRTEVEHFIQELAHKVVVVTITSNVTGTAIAIDDRSVGTTPLEGPLRVNPGPHRIAASKAGLLEETKAIDLPGGERLELPFTLREIPREPVAPEATATGEPAPAVLTPPPPPTPTPTLPPPPVETKHPPTWIGWTVTGAFAAGALATGVAALAKSHELAEEVNDGPTAIGTIHATHDSTATLALVSDVLGGAAIAAAGITLYVTITSRRGPSTSPATHAEVSAGPTGVTLRGNF